VLLRKVVRLVPAVLILAFCFAPLVGVIGSSLTTKAYWQFPFDGLTFKWYRLFVENGAWLEATQVSMVAAALVGTVGVAIGFCLALTVARGAGSRLRGLLQAAILFPLVIPALALGLAIYTMYAGAGVPINSATLAAAQLILVLPLITGLIVVGLAGIKPNVERAAASLGATPLNVFRRVTVPLVRSALVAAGIIAFVRSFDDAAIALFVNSGPVVTLPVRMLIVSQQEPGPLIAAAGSFLLLIALAMAMLLDRTIGLSNAFGVPPSQQR
jgi:putative spermidine/putrescine transport system permease protein